MCQQKEVQPSWDFMSIFNSLKEQLTDVTFISYIFFEELKTVTSNYLKALLCMIRLKGKKCCGLGSNRASVRN